MPSALQNNPNENALKTIYNYFSVVEESAQFKLSMNIYNERFLNFIAEILDIKF